MVDASRSLDEHRMAFEIAFFAKSDEASRDGLRGEGAIDRINELLAGVADSDPEEILERLKELGLGSDVLVVLTLYPLIAVAWADGRVDERERRIVLDAADRAGITRNGLNYRLLESWLCEVPDAALLELWKHYARAVSDAMGRDWESRLAEQILSLCERVALASGGFLALDKIASSEYAVLRELRSAFD
jgi:hypothetical protein